MTNSIWIILTFIIGGLISLQGAINSQLGKVTQLPVFASFASFLIGTLTLSIPFIFKFVSFPSFEKVSSIPLYLWMGGILGAIFVTAAIFIIPHIGITLFVAFVILGQLSFGLIIDHFGLFGLPIQEVSPIKILGISLILIGALLTR